MPYIPEDDRQTVETFRYAQSAGELNYLITTTINQYIKDNRLSYRTINDILGALEGAKLEFYRRVAAPYEDTKIEENGDVY